MCGYGSVARFFDAEYDEFRQDIDFYLDRLATERIRGPVLEPGCGTGRVAAPIAAAGFRVSGLDNSTAMLRRARRRRRALSPEARLRLRFSLQDMTSFTYRYPFQAAILAFSGFDLLSDATARRACLERVAGHLVPGGLLLADLFNPARTSRQASAVPKRLAGRFRLAPHGHLIDKFVEECDDVTSGVITVRYSYQERRRDEDPPLDRLRVEFTLAPIGRREMEAALYAAGFDVEVVFGDYFGRPYNDRSPRMIFQARRLA